MGVDIENTVKRESLLIFDDVGVAAAEKKSRGSRWISRYINEAFLMLTNMMVIGECE